MKEKLWHRSYAAGVKKNLDYEKVTISGALTRSAERFPKKVALDYMGTKITYKKLDEMVNQCARAFEDLGIRKGDKVAVALPNIPQVVIANLAIFRIGAVTVQNNPLYTERELEYQLNDSDSRIIVTMSLLVPRIQKIMANTKLERIIACHIHSYLPFPKKQLFPFVKKAMHREIETSETLLEFTSLIKKYSTDKIKDKSSWDDIGAILYTGGTTGVSKGVMLTHKNLSVNVQQFASWFPGLNPGEEKLVGTFPIFHTAGFTAIQNFIIWMAWEHLMIPRPEPKGIIELVKKHKPGWLPGVPTIFVGLLADPEFRKLNLKFIKGFVSGAAPLAADTIRDMKDLTGATMYEVYGLTETAPIATVSPWGGKVKPGTVGIPVADTDIKIVDLETGEKELKTGDVGEIVIKGPQVMQGYYKKPEETKKVLKDGWFFSGDIGVFDEDGYLSVVDRKKDMIIAAGYNIYPVEIDGVLYENPKVLEACTIGIPDQYRGETVKAFIVVKPGEKLSEDEITRYCKEKLAAYKVPKIFEFVDDIPKSAVGKILRRKLRDMEIEKMKKK